jgi:predicted nucleotidyltransferase component of viral defense system
MARRRERPVTPRFSLPPLPDRALLADLCRETADRERLQPHVVEKDFYLTRLLWALGQTLGDQALLKGGTLLSKVDLGFKRMSEDVDLVVPRPPSREKRANVVALNEVRRALREVAVTVGFRLPFPDGAHFERGAHRQWDLPYESDLGPQSIKVEASLHPTARPARRVSLAQLLTDPLVGSYAPAFCYALDADEARAEKVRAAFTREAVRDLYDLEQLARAGTDLSSNEFVALVDTKLAELGARPLREQARSFGAAVGPRRKTLETSLTRELQAVLRIDEPTLDLDATFARFDSLWGLKS